MTSDAHRNDLALAEAALFLASQPLSRRALARILGDVAVSYVDQLLDDLKEQYGDANRGIELYVQDGRAILRVKPVYVDQVAHLAPQQDIPRPILRTLAVIAYNNPMTQADLIKVRGNKGYGHVQELLERRLIEAEDQGRTLLLSVTKEFLRHFGLSSVEEFRFHFAASPEDGDDEESETGAPVQSAQEDEVSADAPSSHATEQDEESEEAVVPAVKREGEDPIASSDEDAEDEAEDDEDRAEEEDDG